MITRGIAVPMMPTMCCNALDGTRWREEPELKSQRHGVIIAIGLALSLSSMAMSQPSARASAVHFSANVVIAVGTVTDSHGQPVSGASVVLDAWPKASVWPGISNPPMGAHVPWKLVSRTTTNAAGGYVISAASLSALRAEAGPSGIIDLELTVFSPAGGMMFGFPGG